MTMITFWTGFSIFIAIGILIIFIGSRISKKKWRKDGALGGLLGFFVGAGFVFFMLFSAGRLYVVTGDNEFSDFLVYGKQSYKLKNGQDVPVVIEGKHCMVINDWDKPVVVEFIIYGGYGFGGDTKWVEPQEGEQFDERKIFYFFEDGPPEEISVRGGDDSEKYVRLWLRNKRD